MQHQTQWAWTWALMAMIAAVTVVSAAAADGGCYAPSALNFTSERGALWVNGHSFKLKGTSWFGFETAAQVAHGLWAQSYTSFLDFLAANGFNAIRLPFHLGLALNDAQPSGVNYGANADLQGLSSLEVMDKIVEGAAERGITIMLDLHSFGPDSYLSDGMWYTSSSPEATVIQGWKKLLQRYKDQWNVIAADLKNEPHAATWGTGSDSTDWNLGAARLANAIAAGVSDRFLMFVEGVTSSPSTADPCFYGENISGAKTHPVELDHPSKLVYSPHVYGPNVYGQPYFSVGNFPANMPAVWDDHFGFAAELTGSAVVIGEWGGPWSGADAQWMSALADYLVAKGMTDQFFWCLNPNSGDTGGLLQEDWATPETDKLSLLASLVSAPTTFAVNAQGQVCVNGADGEGSTPSPSSQPSASPVAEPSASPAVSPSNPAPSPSSQPSASPDAQPTTSPASEPSPSPSPPSAGGLEFFTGTGPWWIAVTIPGSTSVELDCGNGEGFVAMTAGWSPNLWTFSSATNTPCGATLKFKVDDGAVQTVPAPY